MKAVVQRVVSACARGNDEIISSIENGLCVLLGISKEDTLEDVKYIVGKILDTRLFEDGQGKRWACSVKTKQLEVLVLSQVTLYHTLKGNKPEFRRAMPPAESKKLFATFVATMRKSYSEDKVKEGKFGEYLVIDLQNDGPVTVVFDSPARPVERDPQTKEVTNSEENRTKEAPGDF